MSEIWHIWDRGKRSCSGHHCNDRSWHPTGHSKHSLDLPIGLIHRLGDGNVVSSLHCM